MLDIELMLACLTLCYSDVTGAHHRPPIWSGDRGEELLTLAIMDYPTSFMKKWGKKDHLKHCSFFKEKAAIEVYLVVLKRDRIAFRGKNFYIKGKSTFRAFCKIEEPAAVCISPAPHSILVSSYNISTQVFRRWCWSACFLSYYSSSALVVKYFFFVAFFVPRVFQSCDDELHVLYSSSDDVHSCDAPNIQYIFCWKEGGLRDRCSG